VNDARTLGPCGPFRQSGVDMVSQLAHRRAGEPRPDDSLQGAAPPAARAWPPASARRVDGVPSDSVQSTGPPP